MSRNLLFALLGIALAGILAAVVVWDQSTGGTKGHGGIVEGTVWVAEEEANSLVAIDASTNEVVARLTGIEGPHNVQVAPDGESVWAVSGHESLALMLGPDYTLHGVAPTGKDPAHVVVTPDGRTAYATNGTDNSVTVIDTESMEVVATIPVGEYPHGLRPSPGGKWVYVANAKGSSVSVIDTAKNQEIAQIEVGERPVQVAFSPNGQTVYASLSGEDAVAKIDVVTRTVVGKLKTGVGPIQTYVSPDGKFLLVANQGTEENPGTTVSIVDTDKFEVLDTVETGEGAHGVVIDPSSRHAYITNIYGGDVAVLDLKERAVVARIPTAAKPNGISFSELSPAEPTSPVVEISLPEHEDTMPDME